MMAANLREGGGSGEETAAGPALLRPGQQGRNIGVVTKAADYLAALAYLLLLAGPRHTATSGCLSLRLARVILARRLAGSIRESARTPRYLGLAILDCTIRFCPGPPSILHQ